MGRPTIIDVAKAAGVSKSTVSLVLQNSPTVAATTREDVRRAMAEIGYVYNRAAANLRSSQVGLIGLVINDLRNPFFTEFATSVQMALSEAGYAAVLANTDEDPLLQQRAIAGMVEHGVSALIISPAYGDEGAFALLQRAGIPALQVLRKVSDRTDLFPFSAPDYGLGGAIATRHLLESGARRIAFVGGVAGRAVTSERMSGYLAAMEAAGLPPRVILGRPTRAFGRQQAEAFAAARDVDAALCFNDLVALGMHSGLTHAGIAIGSAFRLVGFDGIEETDQSLPALTSVHCDIAGFGRRAAEQVLDWLSHGTRPAPEERTPVQLVIRGSSSG